MIFLLVLWVRKRTNTMLCNERGVTAIWDGLILPECFSDEMNKKLKNEKKPVVKRAWGWLNQTEGMYSIILLRRERLDIFEEQKGNQMNGFQMRKITSYLNWYCLSDNVSFLSDLAKNIFFLVFINLIMMYLGVDSHGSIFFEVLESVGLYLLSNLGIFSLYSFTYIYYPYTLSFLLLRLWHKIMLNLLVPADP